MKMPVFAFGEHLEIGRIIILPITIDMMDVITRRQIFFTVDLN